MNPILLPRESEPVTDLPFGGSTPAGDTVAVNSRYLTRNGKPWFPVSGEFQFSRYRREDWERELCKMKAGGVTLIASYIFWIHHEEAEGVWDFSGQRDLRAFAELCGKLELPILLRIGPWCHGECRNGGFPDWICFQDRFKTRTDDPTYLAYVRRWYRKLAEEVKGLLWSDGGPVIGVQIENEYRAYAEPDHEKRRAHMHTLRKLAEECGFTVPLYTATAWGTATLNEMETLPVLGGYADEAWSRTTAELKESTHFLFQPPTNDQSIGSDLKTDDGNFSFDIDMNRYPFLTAEIGGGMQVTLRRRVVIDAKDTESIVVCTVGSGAGLIGYYMYHGGTNPDGKLTTLEESAAVGAPNTLPVKSYDFQGILRENGDPHESYHRLRRHHYLLREFGWLIAPAMTVLPEDTAKDPADFRSLRYAVRHDPASGGGFVWINNHLRRRKLAYHPDVTLTLDTGHGIVSTPPVNIRDQDIRILPYNLPLGDGCVLTASNATPLCRIGSRWFFYTDDVPVYRFAGKEAEIITLTNAESLRAFLLGDRLYVTDRDDCLLYGQDGGVVAEFYADTHIRIRSATGDSRELLLTAPETEGSCTVTAVGENLWELNLTYPDTTAEPMLTVNFLGDRAEIFDARKPDRLIADWFTSGLPLRLALEQYGKPESLRIRIYPSEENRYFDLPVESGCAVLSASMTFRHHKTLPSR